MRTPEIAGEPRRRALPGWRAIALIAAAGALVIVAERAFDRPPQRSALAPIVHAYGPHDFGEALALADRDVAAAHWRVDRDGRQWMYRESLARALAGRARLTGGYDDLAAAAAAIAKGLAMAPAGAGPLLTAAATNLAVHDIAPIGPLLRLFGASVIQPPAPERAEAAALAGDLAFYSGNYRGAAAGYARAAVIEDGPGIVVRRSILAKAMGDFAGADRALDGAMPARPTRRAHAMLLLNRGSIALASGRWAAARAAFVAADRVFPGWWLAQAHVAQMRALDGDLGGAEAGYRRILAAMAAPEPSVLDALASLCMARGDVAAARAAAGQAGVLWATRLRLLPTAALAHAAEHELALGDANRGLALAQANYRARPYGDALLLRAGAELATGDPQAVAQSLALLQASGWRSARQLALAGDVEALLAHPEAADAARRAALAIDPRALDPARSLIWFGNH